MAKLLSPALVEYSSALTTLGELPLPLNAMTISPGSLNRPS